MDDLRPCPYCGLVVPYVRVVKSPCVPLEVEVPAPHDAPCGLACGDGFRGRGREHHPGHAGGCPRCGGGKAVGLAR